MGRSKGPAKDEDTQGKVFPTAGPGLGKARGRREQGELELRGGAQDSNQSPHAAAGRAKARGPESFSLPLLPQAHCVGLLSAMRRWQGTLDGVRHSGQSPWVPRKAEKSRETLSG